MRKYLTAGLAALSSLAILGAAASPVQAQSWHGHGGWHGGGWHGRGGWHRGGWHDRDDWGWGVGAGIAGFALGAALASPHYGYGYYGYPGYYDDYPGYYGYDGGSCVSTRRVWDPYAGAYVIRRFYYAC
ncbi:MAG: hypothetical protein ACREEW_07665 [Caulobacteraceae bacterium]